MRFRFVALLGASLLMAACIQTTYPDPHHHVVDINNNGLGSNAAKFKMAEVSVEPNGERESSTVNQEMTFQAFFACDQGCRVLVEELATGQTHELQAPSFAPWRPSSDPVWVTNDILVFDQWMQPHHGVHYAVDVRARKLILASPFPYQLP